MTDLPGPHIRSAFAAGSPSQVLEERVDRLITEIYGITTLARRDKTLVAEQSIETQLLLSFLESRVVPRLNAIHQPGKLVMVANR